MELFGKFRTTTGAKASHPSINRLVALAGSTQLASGDIEVLVDDRDGRIVDIAQRTVALRPSHPVH
jgi:hypothetical protein